MSDLISLLEHMAGCEKCPACLTRQLDTVGMIRAIIAGDNSAIDELLSAMDRDELNVAFIDLLAFAGAFFMVDAEMHGETVPKALERLSTIVRSKG